MAFQEDFSAPQATSASASAPPSSLPARLTPQVQEHNGYWTLTPDARVGINPVEKLKLEKDPMKFYIEGDIKLLAAKSMEEIDSSKEGKDDIDSRLKWLGLFHRRKHHYGRFMMRLKLPNGVTSSAQTRYLASVIEKYGSDGCADVTTRQNWQIRGVVIGDVPEILEGLANVGLSSLQSGMDNVRNAVGNPLAGIDPHEIVDTRPYNKALNDYIISNGRGNTSITNLPRKWNVCVVGTHDLFEHPHINDLAYMPAMKDGRLGFNLLVGGFFSPKRVADAVPLDAWVSAEDVVEVCKAVLEAYRDLGSRGNRQKTRMMWLIDELGIEVFRAEVEKRMKGGKLERAAEKDMIDASWNRRDYLGVHPQKQEGFKYVGLHIPVGRLQAKEMFELARLADEYGQQELRLTVEQNIILPYVPNHKVEALLKEPLLEIFSPWPSPWMGGLVACTGSQFCGVAIIETKARAAKLAEKLAETMEVGKKVRMHWTGCPNSCGQVQVADIGFMGCMTRDENNKVVEGVDIYLGGRVGADCHLGDLVKKGVPCKDLLPVVQDILVQHFGAKRKPHIQET